MRREPKTGAFVLACAALLLTVRTSRADAMDPALLDALVESANEAVDDYRLADARDAWLQVWTFKPSRIAACNIGELSFRMGDMRRASKFLEVCVRDGPTGAAITEKDKVHVLSLATVRQRVAAAGERTTKLPSIVRGGGAFLASSAVGPVCALVALLALTFGFLAPRRCPTCRLAKTIPQGPLGPREESNERRSDTAERDETRKRSIAASKGGTEPEATNLPEMR